MFVIEEEAEKASGKAGVYLMHDEKMRSFMLAKHQSEKPGTPVFSEQQK